MGRTIGNSFYRPGGLSGRLVLLRSEITRQNWTGIDLEGRFIVQIDQDIPSLEASMESIWLLKNPLFNNVLQRH